MHALPPPFRRALPVLIVVVIVGLAAMMIRDLTQPPADAAEAANHLERDVIAYTLQDGTPYAVAEFGGKVRFDRMILDPISIEWPPTPRWQLSGNWTSIPIAADPASAGMGFIGDTRVIYGEITDPRIVSVDYFVDDEWHTTSVAAPGFIIRLDEEAGVPFGIRWLDADGDVVWSLDGLR